MKCKTCGVIRISPIGFWSLKPERNGICTRCCPYFIRDKCGGCGGSYTCPAGVRIVIQERIRG